MFDSYIANVYYLTFSLFRETFWMYPFKGLIDKELKCFEERLDAALTADGPTIVNQFYFQATDSRGMKQLIHEQAKTIRNIVAEGINSRRAFRTVIASAR